MTTVSLGPSPRRRAVLARRVRLLVAATITYNLIEAAVALTAGTLASSGALVAFGLDSVVEVATAAAVAWQFSARDPAVIAHREKRALRIIAVSFFVLALYVTTDALRTLLGACLSAVLLIGLAVNSLLGWTWADPLAALVIAAVALKEGRDAWRGDIAALPGTWRAVEAEAGRGTRAVMRRVGTGLSGLR